LRLEFKHKVTKNQEQGLLDLEDALEVVREMLLKTGIEESALEMAMEVNKIVIEKFNLEQTFVQHLRKLRHRCSEQFIKNLYASLLVQAMAQKFSWYSTAILERMVMAITLSDIMLTNKNYQLIKAGEFDKLDAEGRAHPLDAAQIISRSKKFFHPEIVAIIEQHHEWPNGTGFPKKLKGNQISTLSAFVITANAFVDLEFMGNFEVEAKYKNLEHIYEELFVQNNYKNFKEAVSGLFLALGLNFPKKELL
jgi:HD-GYP domain-containing protein (c-di-GMP phosphodiesterase class II)